MAEVTLGQWLELARVARKDDGKIYAPQGGMSELQPHIDRWLAENTPEKRLERAEQAYHAFLLRGY